MKERFTKDNVLTLPNIISFFRILLIPVFLWLYVMKKDYRASAVVFVVSFISDILDGLIARNMGAVSDLGKVLDPLADKLTQLVVMVSLATRYRILWLVIIIFILKEISVFFLGLHVYMKKDRVHSARWHGKVVTGVITFTMLILLLVQNPFPETVRLLSIICISTVTLSFILYLRFFLTQMKKG